MKIDFAPADAAADAKAALVVSVFEKSDLTGAAKSVDEATSGALTRAIKGGRFTGALGQTLDLAAPHGLDAARVLLVGLGPQADVTGRTVELAAGHAYQALKTSGVETILVR